jgi:hypothetical protein
VKTITEVADELLVQALHLTVKSLTEKEWVDTLTDPMGLEWDRYEKQIGETRLVTVFIRMDGPSAVGLLAPGAFTPESATSFLADATARGDA